METPKANKWKSWKTFVTKVLAVIGALSLILGAIKGGVELNELFRGQPKPQILDIQNCKAWLRDPEQQIEFELLVNNRSSKDFSVISMSLIWPNGLSADFEKHAPSLPLTIPSGQTVRMTVLGYCGGRNVSIDPLNGPRKKLELPKDQNTVEGTLSVGFNTSDIIKRKINFPISPY